MKAWLRAHSTSQQVALRAAIVLRAADGWADCRIAAQLGVTRSTVLQWRKRYSAEGVQGLTRVRPGRGRKRRIGPHRVRQIVKATLHTRPQGATHWSCRTLAQAQGVSPATVQRIWGDAHGLQPHRVRTFNCPS
ncbi:MAG: helix-turn-helix domain-containing protein [Nitrospinota bacterium]